MEMVVSEIIVAAPERNPALVPSRIEGLVREEKMTIILNFSIITTPDFPGKASMARQKSIRGFTLIEAIISIAVFGILLVAIIGLAVQMGKVTRLAGNKTTGATIAAEQMEIIRNLPYDTIGTSTTYPTGPLLASQTISRNNTRFTVTLNILLIDDPADGSAPADTVPADYKRVEVRVCWDTGSCQKPIRLTSTFVPKTLEYAMNAGALFITVIDANGQPVSGANVDVTNPSPSVHVVNQTDVRGQLQLLSLPASANSYHVVVTKSGYSSDQTYAPSVTNPNPVNPDTSVLTSDVTNITLAIDHVSRLQVKTLDQISCAGVGSVAVRVKGSRLIGQNPDVPVYDQTFATDASGQFLIANLPWDNYTMTVSSSNQDVVGITPPDTIVMNPGAAVTASVVMAAHQPETARIIVRDAGTHAPITGASVTISDSTSYTATQTTDQGIIEQADWSGGAGQSLVGDPTKYSAASSGMKTSSPNSLTLADTPQSEQATENFQTTALRDGTNTTAAWSVSPAQLTLPDDPMIPGQYTVSAQGQSATVNSLTGVITDVTLTPTEALNDQTVEFFAAADGTTFEPVTPSVKHDFATTGSDLRWRAVLTTTDVHVTPVVTTIALQYTIRIRTETTGTLTSSTFDNGEPTNLSIMSWEPSVQPAGAGSAAVRFQVATSDPIIGAGTPTVDAASSPGTNPLYTKNIGDASSTVVLAQSFTAGVNDAVESIDVKLAQHNAPTSIMTMFIYADESGAPGLNLSGSGQERSITVPDDGSATWADAWVTQSFAPNTSLVAGTKYWLVIKLDTANSSKYWTVLRSQNDTTYPAGTALVGPDLATLTPVCGSGCDLAFQIRMSGRSITPTTPTSFSGPDGTSSSYYDTSGSTIHPSMNNHQYFRYKLLFSTEDSTITPSISRLAVIKNNACTPPGQAFFSPVPVAGTYSLQVSAPGYDPSTGLITINGNVTQYINLTPTP